MKADINSEDQRGENAMNLRFKSLENANRFITKTKKTNQFICMDMMKVYDLQIEFFYNNEDYNSALDYTIKLFEQFRADKLDDRDTVYNQLIKFIRLRKEMIKCWNIFTLRHLEKNENENAKSYLDLIDKYSIEDYSSYVTTKTNLSCYFNNTNNVRNSKKVMSDIRRINIMKKLNDIYSDSINEINFERKDENSVKSKKIMENFNFSDIALDYNNICSIQNKLKNYHDGLIEGMHSVALNQFTCVMKRFNQKQNEKKNNERDVTAYNLIMSYYNMGVQQEFMSRLIDSENSFNESINISDLYGMDDHPLFKKLKSKQNNFSKNKNLRSTMTLPPIKDINVKKRSSSYNNPNNCSINFQETFTNNEMMLFKLNPNPIEERVNKIVTINEKLKSNPYYSSTINFKKTGKILQNSDTRDFIF